MGKYFIGIDLGGTTTRAAVYDEKGRELSVYGCATELLTPQSGYTERDMTVFRDTAFYCVKKAVEEAAVCAENISCIGLSGHGKGLYLLGKDFKPIRNGIISTDTRGAKYIEEWNANGVADLARKKTCQNLQVSQPAILLRWLKDNERQTYGKIGAVLEAKDYIRFALTDKVNCEYTDISGTSLLNLHTRSYDDDLLELFGISEIKDALPKLVRSSDICGFVTKEAAKMCGIKEGTPVNGGMFDIDACLIATGITDCGDICAIAGTWSINEYLSKEPILDGSVAMNSLFCLPEYYLIEESSPTSAGNLSWYINSVLSEDKARAKKAGGDIYREINENAENADTSSLYFLPYVFGSQFNANSKGAFVGLDGASDKYKMAKAVMEGVAFNHKAHIDRLLQSRKDNPPEKIRLAGGAANSKLWVQILSDVLNMPIQTVASKELGALGAAISAAVSCKVYPSITAAVENMVRLGETILPCSSRAKNYAERYKVFRTLEEKLRGM